MKYVNSKNVLPEALINEIRQYAQGVYIYIPKEDHHKYQREETEHQKTIGYRNRRIYDAYLRGESFGLLAEKFCLSNKSIRRIVLAKQKEMAQLKMEMNRILESWEITGDLRQISHTTWDVDNRYVLKSYEDLTMVKRNAEMFKILYKEGIPVPKVLETLDQRDFVELGDRQYLLTEKLQGRKITNTSSLDKVWFNKFGQIIGQLHKGFSKCEKTMSFWNNSMLEEMKGWVSDHLSSYKPDYLDEKAIRNTINQLAAVYEDLPKQLIHRDVHLGNFLFTDDGFTGYVDFDLSQSNIRIVDISYFLLGLISKEAGDKSNDQQWFSIVREVVTGYDSVMNLSKIEKQAMPCVMANIELLFVAYFLSKGDDLLARDAASLFDFIKGNESLIEESISEI